MFRKQAGKVLLVVFLINAVLVATHKGEFWPFSIYPMFSKAGKPWTRALIRDVTDVPDSLIWRSYNYPELPGQPATTLDLGIDNIDYSNFVCKTKNWTKERTNALRYMIGEKQIEGKKLLAMKVSGQLNGISGVSTVALPFLLFDHAGNHFNPQLDSANYFNHENR